MDNAQRCGYVALVGRPNVGKSTLLNALVGQKLSITSRKPQTTRQHLLGIKTQDNCQVIYVDTPGLHDLDQAPQKAINRFMNRAASSVMKDVDLVLFLVDRLKWTHEDELVLKQLKASNVPIIVVINKEDRLANKSMLLPHMGDLAKMYDFEEIIPISALMQHNIDTLESLILKRLPEGQHLYDKDDLTDRSTRYLIAELIREKLVRMLGDELPYETAVEIERMEERDDLCEIHALILVERAGQKAIVIGEKGARLKELGTLARQDIQKLLNKKVFLKTWVKVKSGWSDDDSLLRQLGYVE